MNSPVETILERLKNPHRNDSGWEARCPAHEDNHPSLSITENAEGAVLLKCHAGCDTRSVVAAINLTMGDLFPPKEEKRIVATYDYTDENGILLSQVVRYDPKDFRNRRPGGPGEPEWIWKLGDTRRVLYHLPAVLAETEHVFIVEGEKDADAMTERGLTATTNLGGAGKWRPEYATTLNHIAKVTVIADRDDAGREHARTVARTLTAAQIEVVQPPEGCKDISDMLTKGLTRNDLEPLEEIEETLELDRFTPIDLAALMSSDPPEEDWLAEPVLAARKHTGIISKRGEGKSLLLLDIAACKATGRATLEQSSGPPAHVVYIDMEMGPDDLYDRLNDLGWTPDTPDFPTLVEHLHYYQLIDLPPLDTEPGGQALEELVDKHSATLVIIDTVSRVISGDENAAESFRDLFRYTETRLKRKGVTLARLDHLGKDATKGSRGSSAKEDPLDVVWHLNLTAVGTIVLTRTKGRQGWIPTSVTITRETVNGILRHMAPTEFAPEWLIDLVFEIDQLGLPTDAGKPAVQKALQAIGKGRRRDAVAKAVKFRKGRVQGGPKNPDHPGPPPGTTSGTTTDHPSINTPLPGVMNGTTSGTTPDQEKGGTTPLRVGPPPPTHEPTPEEIAP